DLTLRVGVASTILLHDFWARRHHGDELAAEERVVGLHRAAHGDIRYRDADSVCLRLLEHPADRVAAVPGLRECGELLSRRLASERFVEDRARAEVRRQGERALAAEQVRPGLSDPVLIARARRALLLVVTR